MAFKYASFVCLQALVLQAASAQYRVVSNNGYPNVVTSVSETVSCPGPVLSGPVLSGPGPCLSAPGPVLGLPGQVLSSLPGQVLSGLPGQVLSGQVVGLPGQVFSGYPGQVLSGLPGQVLSGLPVEYANQVAYPPTVVQDSSVSNNLANALQLLVVSSLLNEALPFNQPEVVLPGYGGNVVLPAGLNYPGVVEQVASPYYQQVVSGLPSCGCGYQNLVSVY